jgi:hypothetical protein
MGLSAESFRALRETLRGALFLPGDPLFTEELAPFNAEVVHRPQAAVVVAEANDVRETLRFAIAHRLPISIHATGHGVHRPITEGIAICTRRLDALAIDPVTRTATFGAGVRWKPLIAAAAAHGLLPIPGSSASVGAVGYLLGGGLGPLARSHGFSSDYLESLDVVTGDGELREVSAASEPDLFWALRGGKKGLGVVTRARLKLVELTELYAGSLFFAEEAIEPALRGWLEWTGAAHPRVTTSAAVVRFPPFEQLPPQLRGRRLLTLRFAFPGSVDEGARLAAPLRALGPLVLDQLGPMPAGELARIHGDPETPGPSWVQGMLLRGVDQRTLTALLALAGPESPFAAAELRHLGDATRYDVPGGSAVGGRPADFTLGLLAVDPSLFETACPEAERQLVRALQPWAAAETNINFTGRPRDAAHLASAWSPATLQRLETLRRRSDPHRLLL